jgi:hypothetical protein
MPVERGFTLTMSNHSSLEGAYGSGQSGYAAAGYSIQPPGQTESTITSANLQTHLTPGSDILFSEAAIEDAGWVCPFNASLTTD